MKRICINIEKHSMLICACIHLSVLVMVTNKTNVNENEVKRFKRKAENGRQKDKARDRREGDSRRK